MRSAGLDAAPNKLDHFAAGLLGTLTTNVGSAFQHYVEACAVSRWLIATDFCIGTTHRNDTFVYTVIPGDDKLPDLDGVARILPRDLKHTRKVDSRAMEFLKRPDWFSLVFLPNKGRRLASSHQQARDSLDAAIFMMESWPNASTHIDLIRKSKEMRQKASARGFNLTLFNDVVLASALGSIVGVLLCKCTNVAALGWTPDRDAITQKWRGIANLFFFANLHAFCMQHGIQESPLTAYFGPEPGQPGNAALWYDALVRIPDYLAGAVAGCDLTGERTWGRTPKHHDIIVNVIRDNPNVALVRLDFTADKWTGTVIRLSGSPS